MPGEFKHSAANNHTAIKTAKDELARAWCEGRESLVTGAGTNPHPSGSADNIAWQAGHDTVTPEGLVDNCAYCIPITVANVVGSSLAAATATLNAQGLAVGKVTLTTGNVTIQSPAAAAKTQLHQTVLLTLTS